MKRILILLFFGITNPTFAQELEVLTEADREALLGQLEAISNDAKSRVDARFRVAMSAYQSAMSSDSAALKLHLACKEKVEFEDMKKDSKVFRDWKRENSDSYNDPYFKLALRYQLRWLVLTLIAASEDPDRARLASEASSILEQIFVDAGKLTPHQTLLSENVTNSAFAKAYDISNVRVENWPLSPTEIDSVFNQVILPPLRQPGRTSAIRQAWSKRILYEGIKADKWTNRGKDEEKLKDNERSPAFEKFTENRIPQLQWETEVDVFKAGDQRGAAVRMLAHIEAHLAHHAAPKWAESFTKLLTEDLEEAPTPEEDLGGEPPAPGSFPSS